MNKKYLKYAALTLLFTFINPSFAMGGKIFKLARFVGVGTSPYFFSSAAYDLHKNVQIFDKEKPLSGSAIEQWGQDKIKQLHISHAESISFVEITGWRTNGTLIGIPAEDVALHESIRLGTFVHDQDKKLALHSITLKHEVGHIVHNDNQNHLCHMIAVPLGIEAVSFGLTKSFRKLCNIQEKPKTFLKTMFRSSCSIGSIAPKMFFSLASIMFLSQQQEIKADQYACENAESRLELEVMANEWREQEIKEILQRLSGKEKSVQAGSLFSTHPSSGTRKEIAESYLSQWDREHAHEAGKIV